VDLAASAFLSWQVGLRRTPAAAAPAVPLAPDPAAACLPARVVRVASAETLELLSGDGPARETVHLACLDAPETRHKFEELVWLGQQAAAAVEGLAGAGSAVCVGEDSPALRDRQGHRVVYLRLPDGRDLGAEVIRAGLGLARPGPCARGSAYRDLERRAREADRGLWGPAGNPPLVAVVAKGMAAGGPAMPPARMRGG
jgi:endonuclease YncB( thermonuclease family)